MCVFLSSFLSLIFLFLLLLVNSVHRCPTGLSEQDPPPAGLPFFSLNRQGWNFSPTHRPGLKACVWPFLFGDALNVSVYGLWSYTGSQFAVHRRLILARSSSFYSRVLEAAACGQPHLSWPACQTHLRALAQPCEPTGPNFATHGALFDSDLEVIWHYIFPAVEAEPARQATHALGWVRDDPRVGFVVRDFEAPVEVPTRLASWLGQRAGHF